MVQPHKPGCECLGCKNEQSKDVDRLHHEAAHHIGEGVDKAFRERVKAMQAEDRLLIERQKREELECELQLEQDTKAREVCTNCSRTDYTSRVVR